MKYDLFVSYSRKDNDPEWLSGFVRLIKSRHLEFAGRELQVFFDRDEIGNGDQWRHRILGALRDSAFLIAVVSPGYFASDYCRWEFDEFVSREFERFSVGEAIGPIYWIAVPGIPDEGHPDPWKANLSRRNMSPVPLRPWTEGLEASLRERDVEQKLHGQAGEIAKTVKDRVDRRELAERSPTNLDNALSPNFVGRARELVMVHESLAFGRVGAITSVQGIGGIGKTELAFAYAKAYAHEYPGGRWLVPCDGRSDLKQALADAMAVHWSIPPLSEDFSAEMRWAAFLERLGTHGKALFVLDNVSEREAISSKGLLGLPSHDRAAFLVTTRLGCKPRYGELDVVDLDRLEPADGVALLRRFRPRADSSGDFEVLTHLVNEVGGHALALEAIGVYLRENPGIALAEYKTWFDSEVLGAVEALSNDPSENKTRHGEVLVGRLLAPTLQRLEAESPLAMQAARAAAFLPPDAVYEPWLRELVLDGKEELLAPSRPGPKSDWDKVLDALERNLLLRFQGRSGRMHRILGELLRDGSPEFGAEVDAWFARYADRLLDAPRLVDAEELDALEALGSGRRVDSFEAVLRSIKTGRLLVRWHRFQAAARLYKALDAWPLSGNRESQRLKSVVQDEVGNVEVALGMRDEALKRYRESLGIRQEVLETFGRSPQALRDVSVSLDNVGDVEVALGMRDEALKRYRESLGISQEVLETFGRSPQALRDVSVSLNNVGDVEVALGMRDEALKRYRESLGISQEVLETFGRSPQALRDVSVSLDNVGDVEVALGMRDEALKRYRESLGISQEVLETFGRSPEALRDVSVSLDNVGDVEVALGMRDEALKRYRESLGISQEVLETFGRSPEALRDVSVLLNKVGDVEVALGMRDEALKRYRESLGIRQEVLETFGRSPEALRDVSVSLLKVGDVEVALGMRDEALKRYRESLGIRQEVLETFGRSPEALRDVSVSLNKVGDVEVALGMRDEALKRYRESLGIRQEVLETFGRSPEALRDVSVSCGSVATALPGGSPERAKVISVGIETIELAISVYGDWAEFNEVRSWLRRLVE